MTTTYIYDGYDSRFPTTITNAENQSETRTYETKFGAVASITDANDQTVSFIYDAMGKKIQETTPYGITYIRHKWDSSKDNSLYSVTTYGTNTPLSKTYYDKFARVVYAYKEGMHREEGEDNYTTTSKIYNKKGQLATQTDPNTNEIIYGYDNYGRQISVDRPNPSGSGRVIDSISYDGLKTTQTTAGMIKIVEKNAQGKITKVTDAAGTSDESIITYTYYADGNLKTTTDSGNNIITMTYDKYGNKTSMNDPDMGNWTYTYDALGRLLTTDDAIQNIAVTELKYDKLGRVVEKWEEGYDYVWEYDTRKIGALTTETKSTNVEQGVLLYKKDYYYKNNKEQLEKTIETFDSKTYTTQMGYYDNGKLRDLIYPNQLTVRHNYKNGYLNNIEDSSTGKTVYEVTATDHNGIVSAKLGNEIITSYGYNNVGLLTSTTGSDKIDLSYTYDNRGNVNQRHDNKIGISETGIEYDYLNRVTFAQVTAPKTGETHDQYLNYDYDNLGNLTQKNSKSLQYNNTRPHALSSVKINNEIIKSYTYDANGNMTNDTKRAITYNPANKPISITTNGQTTTFKYNSSGNRYIKTFGENGMSKTHYIGKLFERTTPNTTQTEYIDKNFIYFGGKLIKIKEKEYHTYSDDKVTDSFIHQDNLGNVIAITDKDGKITSRRSYTPFGEIRNILYAEAVEKAQNLSTIEALKFSTTNRGFTGHESIEGTDGLIHMNGRVYDSSIGRFLSADPFIQAPHDTQSYNRYSYVKNNPLNLTDPSGYFWGIGSFFKKNFKTIVTIAAVIVIGIYAPAALGHFLGSKFAGVVAAGALAGGVSGAIMTGTLEGAFWGGVAAGAAFGVAQGVGSYFNVDAHQATLISNGSISKVGAMKAIAHGLSRAAIAKVQHGTGKGAFLSGFVSSGFSVGGNDKFGAVKMAIVGGTVSAIGGGKFANGAMASAFQYLFNDSLANFVSKRNESVRLSGMNNKTFREQTGFEGSDSMISFAKQKVSNSIIKGTLNDVLETIKNGIIISVPQADIGTVLNALDFTHIPKNGTIVFKYDCRTVNNCGVKMYEK